MLDKVVHAITPALVITAATVLLALGKIDSTTGVALIATAGGYGAIATAVAGKPPGA